ncbi:MAG: phage antirepressor KilAC domain-containing protein [Lachnospiraceae bacterium]
MDKLITVNFDTQTVSARELHKEVGSTERFSTWFERQLQFGFIENEDYTGCKKFNTLAKQELQDYDLSVDMAKQICMVQKNDRARAVRQYLIDLEKAWNTPEQVMARALKMANQTIDKLKNNNIELENTIQSMDKVINELVPKANYVDIILQSKATVLITQIAQDYGMSARAFNKKLSELRIQRKVGGQWILYADYQGKGYVHVHSKTIDIVRSNGQPDIAMQTEWTQKGRLFLYEELKKYNIYPTIEKAA